ncbi:MAG: hypothetical protein WBE86_05925 [Candidatus Acidiferrales bacterium]
MSKVKQIIVQVTGQPPLEAVPALHSNFVGISRAGGEVQFEFIFVDLNQIANMTQHNEAAAQSGTVFPVTGKTIAKIVMPAENFIQLEPHLEKIFSAIKSELKKEDENSNARASSNS